MCGLRRGDAYHKIEAILPRYYFHMRDGVDRPDDIGTDLADDAAALDEAMFTCSDKIRDLGLSFWQSDHHWRMEVTNAAGQAVFTLHFRGQTERHT